MKKTIIYILFIFFLQSSTNVFAQTNLVPNGDFEIYSALPTQMTQVDLAVGWNNVNNNNLNGGCGSPDYSYVGSFMFPCAAIFPFSGNGQMSIGIDVDTNYDDNREYISSHLYLPMATGQQYSVSFYLTNGHLTDSIYGCSTSISNNFGIHFSMDTLTQVCSEIIKVNPQLEITSIINSFDNWTHFIFKYIADSSYNYITLGNFRSNANTLHTYPPLYYNSPYFAYTFFFIDKIEIYPRLKIAGDSIICKGTPTTLKIIAGEPIVNWADSLSPSTIIATDSLISVTPLTTTTYVAYSTLDTAYYTVYIKNSPQVNLGNDTSLCAGQTLTLNATNANSSYQWQDNSMDSTYNVSQQGLYWVKVTNEYNCTVYDTINVNFNPTYNIVVNKTICQGETYQVGIHFYTITGTYTDSLITTNTGCDSIIITNLSVNPSYNYVVNKTICQGQTYQTGTHFYTIAGIYIDTLTTYKGCDSIITTNLIVNPIQQTILNPVICQGETYYENTHTYTTTGIYKDSLTTYLGCDSIVTINLTTVPLPTVNLGNDTLLCYGKVIILNATNASSTYQWQDSTTNPTYNVSQSGTYWVTVTTNNNCKASDTINIIYQECIIPDIYIPNSFTPNGDGLNDIFNIKTTYEFSHFKLSIYNRWGEMIFESEDINKGWDGTFKGKLVPSGVYIYLITATIKDTGEKRKITGRVTVVR